MPYLWWAQQKTLTAFTPRHLRICGVVRSAIVSALIIALMQPVFYRSGAWLSVVYAVDISRSVSPAATQSSLEWIRKTNELGRPAHASFIAFGANSATFDDLERLKDVNVSAGSGTSFIDQTATNIADAIGHALNSFAPHHLKRLVLITDGNENLGRANGLGSALKDQGVQVYTIPEASRLDHDAWIESVTVPSRVDADELFPVEVRVYSQVAAGSEIEIKNGDKRLDRRQVQLRRGLNRITFETQITGGSGPVTIEAEVQASGDTFAENNTFREGITVRNRPRVLYVEGHQESTQYVEQALKLGGFSIDVVPPDRIPSSLDGLISYDAVIVSDVARSSFSDPQMSLIATYVRDLGGGLIFSGGENSYGEGAYFGTLLEKTLPVTFETKKQNGVTLIVVFDKSGSMGGLKIELAKEATKGSAALLRDKDRFGVVAFDQEFYWPVPLQAASNRESIIRAISTIAPGGETNMYPPLRDAYLQLANAKTEIKHVILLSDGISLPGEFEPLIKEMVDAKITLSTVALSMGSDRKFLAKLAELGKGRTYYIEDVQKVPQIFSQETQLATGITLRETSFKPIVRKNVDIFKGIDLQSAPPLRGYVATKPKDTSEIIFESEDHDPILARWQYGLGRTVIFTSDFKDRWGAEWLRWDGYSKFLSQLVRETMRLSESDEFAFHVERANDNATITINAIETDGEFRNKLQPEVRVVAPDQSVSTVKVNQTGPGSYEALFPLRQKGSYVFRASDGLTASASRVLPYSYPDEFHSYAPNTDLLRAISAETGGKFEPSPQEIFEAGGERTSIPTPLWPYLSALALVLFITDVLLRRLRLQ